MRDGVIERGKVIARDCIRDSYDACGDCVDTNMVERVLQDPTEENVVLLLADFYFYVEELKAS